MKTLAIFVVGFASGWGVRAIFGSARGAVVAVTAAGYRAASAARRYAGYEREYFEDLFAEGRARWEAEERRRAAEADEGSCASGAGGAVNP